MPAGLAVGTRASAETYNLRLGLTDGLGTVIGAAAVRLAQGVERQSNGQLTIGVYPNGQLAKQNESVDGLRSGVVDLLLQSTAFLARLMPRFQVFNLPFLFKDSAAAYRTLDGPVGDDFAAELATHDILGLCWGTDGFKQLEAVSRSISVPDDLKGLRIRTPADAVYVATYQALGAVPLTIDFSETFVALQQHAVDATDIPLDLFTTEKFYTIVKHVSLANHFYVPMPLLGGRKRIEGLPANLRKVLIEQAKAIVPGWRSSMDRQVEETVRFLKSNGVEISQIRYAAFRKAVDPIYASYQSKLGADIIDRVTRAAAG